MQNCCLYILSLIFLIILVWILKNIIDNKNKKKLENKHRILEKLKLEREIKDLEIEIGLQEVLIIKKINEFFDKNVEELEIKKMYEELKNKIEVCNIDKALEKLKNLRCFSVKDELENIKNDLNFIKENLKIENILKEIEKLEKSKNEKNFLENKKSKKNL